MEEAVTLYPPVVERSYKAGPDSFGVTWALKEDAEGGTYPAPFDQEFYIILNIAVGGNYPGCLDPSCITATFPQEMRVDYVRLYQ